MVPKCGLWSLYAITQKRPGDDRQSRGNRQISFCWQLRDHTASVVAILRTISTISSHPDQCTTSRGISDQMLDEGQLCCCCTCLCHLYLYLSLPYMLVLVHVCIIWTCTVPSASALPILCYPSLSHNPTWPAQTIVILPSHTEGAHQFARNQIVKPHATAFRHNSF